MNQISWTRTLLAGNPLTLPPQRTDQISWGLVVARGGAVWMTDQSLVREERAAVNGLGKREGRRSVTYIARSRAWLVQAVKAAAVAAVEDVA